MNVMKSFIKMYLKKILSICYLGFIEEFDDEKDSFGLILFSNKLNLNR